ncbi:hypothetical protein [Novosphingobium malaysiense]|uniref:Uncharacterized protein n=1 Tax=Novosphingobium malaysiense TaxID=1348853 RepID=A0A0B1ZSD1_9SPHN|nr:hypothetical protein [Novosphingobium malaysiense]KHK93546.1 hypothetical protein LK12_04675 [Novosphingobium malaysiense]
MKLLSSLLLAAGAVSLAAPGQAAAPGISQSGQYSIGITGFVPVICRTSVDASMVTPASGTVQLGTLRNFCNSPNGYRVYADYSPSLSGASMIVDGQSVTLQPDGSTIIARADRASIDQHSLALDLADGQIASGSISFRIQPL